MGNAAIVTNEETLQLKNEQLQLKLTEAEQTLSAIRQGEVDAIVVNTASGNKIFSLVSSETPYRIIVEEMHEGAVTISPSGIILYCNKRFAELVSKPLNQVLGLHFGEFIGENEKSQFQSLINTSLTERFNREISFQIPNKTDACFRLSFSPLPENMLGSICIITVDITELKQQEAKIKDLNLNLESKITERTGQYVAVNKELEAFTFSVSHDLRAPLRSVISYAQIIEEEFGEKLEVEGKQMLNNIKRNGQKMGKLIDDLLAFSRLGRKEIQKTEVNMDELVKEVVTELNQNFPNKAIIKISALPLVQGDYSLLYQAMLNLISNGIKYSSKKEHPIVEIFAEQKEGKNIFTVKDNGAGFDMRFAEKLFGVFQRLHSEEEFEGNGVGLAIVERIVSKHGGKVWGEGVVNEGASFHFSLP